MSTVIEKRYTPADLLAMPDRKNYELVDGHLVERNVSVLSAWVAARANRLVDTFVEENRLGWTFSSELGYVCFPDEPGKVRKPDVSFVRRERLPEGPTSDGYLTVPPDMVVEVVSPNDLFYEVEDKVEKYLAAGVPLVWVINPEARTVHIHHRDHSIGLLRDGDELSGADVLPGFRCPVSRLFPDKPPGSQTAHMP